MTEREDEYSEPIDALCNRPICIYVTDIPKSFSKQDIEYIFDKLSNQYITVASIEFVPCFYDPYEKKCAYVYFDHWFTSSEEIAIIECHFVINTFYTYIIPRTWFEYWNNEPVKSLKFFYVKKPIRTQIIKENWNLIKEQNIFQEMRRQSHQIRCLKKRLYILEDKMSSISTSGVDNTEEDDISSYHNIS
jgi:hypothetical protein